MENIDEIIERLSSAIDLLGRYKSINFTGYGVIASTPMDVLTNKMEETALFRRINHSSVEPTTTGVNGRRWTLHEEAVLMEERRKGVTAKVIAAKLGRTVGQVYDKVKTLRKQRQAEIPEAACSDVDFEDVRRLDFTSSSSNTD